MSILDVWGQIKKLSIGTIKGGFKVSYTTDLNGSWNYTLDEKFLKNSTPNKWSAIVVHHSENRDGNGSQNDWGSIRSYHKSYRVNWNPVSKEEFEALKISEPESKFELPSIDIAYNIGIENYNNDPIVRYGRPLTVNGAHCIGMNNKAVGICVLGNYNSESISIGKYILLKKCCLDLCYYFGISPDEIHGHYEYANKSCPGRNIHVPTLVEDVKKALG